MRGFKPTPLLIISIGTIIYAAYLLVFNNNVHDPEGWSILAAISFFVGAIIGLTLYFILRVVFKKKMWTQVVTELLIITAFVFFVYKETGYKSLEASPNYNGFVMLIYGVGNAPKLSKPIFSNKIEIKIPKSGIVVTSSSSQDFIKEGYKFANEQSYVVYPNDTIKCNDKKYIAEVWLLKSSSNWNNKDDSIYGLKQKFSEACYMVTK